MEFVHHMKTMCMITLVTVRQVLQEGIVKAISNVSQRTAMVENASLKIPILLILFVFVLLEEWVFSVRQVSTYLLLFSQSVTFSTEQENKVSH